MRRSLSLPVLRILGGALLVLAGFFSYFGIGLGASAVLVIVVGGVVVIAAAFLGHRPGPGDVAIFIVGALVLGAVTAGYSPNLHSATYSALRSQIAAGAISVVITSSGGSIDIGFTDSPDLAYQVNFTQQGWVPSFAGPGTDTVSNSTSNGRFTLDVGSSWSAITVTLAKGYNVDVQATTGTGSISFQGGTDSDLRNVSLRSSTGSVDAVIDSNTVKRISLQADTGSVSIVSHSLGASGPKIPVSLSTSTGSVSASLFLESKDSAYLTASTSLGSISQSLSGFAISQDSRTELVAMAGDYQNSQNSFSISATASVGSININIGFVPG